MFENVAFGLRVKPRGERPPEAEIRRSVHELLELVQLDWLADRYPSQLSGGQRQRVALARALAVEPRVLLLDEPFGALDAKVRKELRRWLRRLHDELHITSLFVTHDQDEALELADQLVLMNQRQGRAGRHRARGLRQPGDAVRLFVPRRRQRVQRPRGRRAPARRQRRASQCQRALVDGKEVVAFARPHEIDIIAGADGLARRRARDGAAHTAARLGRPRRAQPLSTGQAPPARPAAISRWS